ncbi:MAG: endonuclease [Bacteroidetes bacterium]|nr:endonuclease [Bacteroidota bacterium]
MPFRSGIVFIFIFMLYLPSFSQDCPVQFSENSVDFGSIQARTVSTKTVWLKTSPASAPILLRSFSIISNAPVFTISRIAQPVLLQPNDSIPIEIQFTTNQNITFNASVYARGECQSSGAVYSIPITLHGSCYYPDTVYNFTQNLIGGALFQSLKTYLQGQTVLSYYDARNAFFSNLDNRNGEVECVYSGRTIKTTGIPDPNQFNCEHTWPQSKGSDVEPAKTDIYHLYPAWETANTKRSNYAFGTVTRNITWQDGGSKLGQGDGSSDIIFEPRDKHKGNVARSLFYYATRYGNRKGTNDTQGFLTSMESTMRTWNTLDTVDMAEMNRNEGIAKIQLRRNPYIDHPEFVERIYNIGNQPDFPKYPQPVLSDSVVTFGKEKQLSFYIQNTGNEVAVIQAIDFKNATGDIFSIVQFDTTIQPDSRAKIVVNSTKAEGSATARVRFTAGVSSVNVLLQTSGSTSVSEKATAQSEFRLEQNIPNPAVATISIMFQVPESSMKFTTLKFYSLDGKELYDATSDISWHHGEGTFMLLNNNPLPKYSIYRLTAPGYSAAKIMIDAR